MKRVFTLAFILGVAGVASAAEYRLTPTANPTGKGGPIMQRVDRPNSEAPDYRLTGDSKDSRPTQATRPTSSTHDQGTVIAPEKQ